MLYTYTKAKLLDTEKILNLYNTSTKHKEDCAVRILTGLNTGPRNQDFDSRKVWIHITLYCWTRKSRPQQKINKFVKDVQAETKNNEDEIQ
jgi:hypothetical protein